MPEQYSDYSVAERPSATNDTAARPSKLDHELLLPLLQRQFRDDANHSAVWRREAKEDFDFVAGEQWTPEEKSQLKEQLRPEIVFNRTITLIKAVAGFEINGRHEVQFLPRNLQDSAVNEVLTGASKWMSDECDGEDEESEAFQHTLICGMGFTENRLDYEEEPEGKYIEEAINPLEMYWDHAARKKNLADSRRMSRLRKLSLTDAKAMFPGFDVVQLDARWAVGMDPQEETKTIEEKRKREENQTDSFTERHEVNIVQMQWWEREVYWLIADPVENKKIELKDAEFKLLQKRTKELGIELNAVKMTRRCYKQAFIGSVILEVGPAPIPDRFTWASITGEINHSKGVWFGLVRVLRDPQKWANKWLSQTLHIMNSNAKGGILAETDAFDDQRQAEDTYAKPESITWVKKGALSGVGGKKIDLKPTAQFPAGFFQLLEFAVSSLRDVSGINLELLGLRDENQPGILEAQRKQAGMTVLATMFDSLRRFRKQVGRIRLYYIQNFLSDGRLIRVTGQDGAKVIPLIRDKCLGEYDVHVDDAPTSPNQKEANWAIIAPMVGMFKDQLTANPQLFSVLLDYSPLPSRLVDTVKAVMMQPNPDQEKQKQLVIADKVATINKNMAQAELFNKQAGATEATAMYDMAMAQNLLLKHNGDMVAALNDARESGAQAAKTAAEANHITAKTDTERATADNIRSQTAHTQVKGAVDALTPIPHEPPAEPSSRTLQ